MFDASISNWEISADDSKDNFLHTIDFSFPTYNKWCGSDRWIYITIHDELLQLQLVGDALRSLTDEELTSGQMVFVQDSSFEVATYELIASFYIATPTQEKTDIVEDIVLYN